MTTIILPLGADGALVERTIDFYDTQIQDYFIMDIYYQFSDPDFESYWDSYNNLSYIDFNMQPSEAIFENMIIAIMNSGGAANSSVADTIEDTIALMLAGIDPLILEITAGDQILEFGNMTYIDDEDMVTLNLVKNDLQVFCLSNMTSIWL
jgi:hypothetical protein